MGYTELIQRGIMADHHIHSILVIRHLSSPSEQSLLSRELILSSNVEYFSAAFDIFKEFYALIHLGDVLYVYFFSFRHYFDKKASSNIRITLLSQIQYSFPLLFPNKNVIICIPLFLSKDKGQIIYESVLQFQTYILEWI